MARHLTAENGVRLAHAAFEERVPDAVHQRRATVLRYYVLDREARAEIVDDRGSGVLEKKGLRQKRRDEIAADEGTGAVDEKAAVRVAVPGDADIRLFGDDPLHDVAAVLFDERIGFVIRKAPVDLKAQSRGLARQAIEQGGRDQPSHPASGVEHHVERADDRRVDERRHMPEVGVERVLGRDAPADGRRSWHTVVRDHLAYVRDALVSAEGNRFLTHHLDAVVLLRIVRRRNLRAAVVAATGDGEVHEIGRNHPVVDHIGALGCCAVLEGFGQAR